MRHRNIGVFGATLVVLLFGIEGCATFDLGSAGRPKILITILDEPREEQGRWNRDFHVQVEKVQYGRFYIKRTPISFSNAELKIKVQVESPELPEPLEHIELRRTDNGGKAFFYLLGRLPAHMKDKLGEEAKVRVYFSVESPEGGAEKVVLLKKEIVSKLAYRIVQEKIKNIKSTKEAILAYKDFIAKNPSAEREVNSAKRELASLLEREKKGETFEKALENAQAEKDLTQKIEILEKFIQDNPQNEFLDNARTYLEELKFRQRYAQECPGDIYDMTALLAMEDPYGSKGSCIRLEAIEAIQWVPPMSCLCVIRPPSGSPLLDIDPSPSLIMFIEFPKATRAKIIQGMARIVGPISYTTGSGESKTALHLKMLEE